MDAPEPPPAGPTAAQQAQLNQQTAVQQAELGQTDLVGPNGTVSYQIVGYNPDGTPHYQQTTSYSPEQQHLLDLENQGLGTLGEAGVEQANAVKNTLGTPFNLDASRAKQISDIQTQLLDPTWNTREEQLQADLSQRGIHEGDEAYTNAMTNFEDQRTRAYNDMFVSAYQTTNNAALQERELPLSELNQLLRGPTAAPPSEAPPTPGVAPVDYIGLTEAQYQAQMQGYMGQMGAIGAAAGAAGTALGGWLRSDRRLKRDVELIGLDPRGWGVYLFRFIWGHRKHIGYMADEVFPVRPDAVAVGADGYLMVNYGALDHAG